MWLDGNVTWAEGMVGREGPTGQVGTDPFLKLQWQTDQTRPLKTRQDCGIPLRHHHPLGCIRRLSVYLPVLLLLLWPRLHLLRRPASALQKQISQSSFKCFPAWLRDWCHQKALQGTSMEINDFLAWHRCSSSPSSRSCWMCWRTTCG